MTVEDEQLKAPLAAFNGEEPPAPQWFKDAIAQEPERSFVTVKGARIECLTWGERGKPGMIFVHGASAHADWWSYIAPFFAADYRVCALSLSGMGRSDWRDGYDYPTFLDEIDACAHAAGLYEAAVKPVYIGHSMGGGIVYVAALLHPERMRATLMVDNGFGRAPPQDNDREKVRPAIGSASGRVYPTMAAALARFRFLPMQPVECAFIADFIARRSLKAAKTPEGEDGWKWCFDPDLFPKLDRSAFYDLKPSAPGHAVHFIGEHSAVIARARVSGMLARMDPSVITVTIPDAHHHVMVDQPLALVTGLRTALSQIRG